MAHKTLIVPCSNNNTSISAVTPVAELPRRRKRQLFYLGSFCSPSSFVAFLSIVIAIASLTIIQPSNANAASIQITSPDDKICYIDEAPQDFFAMLSSDKLDGIISSSYIDALAAKAYTPKFSYFTAIKQFILHWAQPLFLFNRKIERQIADSSNAIFSRVSAISMAYLNTISSYISNNKQISEAINHPLLDTYFFEPKSKFLAHLTYAVDIANNRFVGILERLQPATNSPLFIAVTMHSDFGLMTLAILFFVFSSRYITFNPFYSPISSILGSVCILLAFGVLITNKFCLYCYCAYVLLSAFFAKIADLFGDKDTTYISHDDRLPQKRIFVCNFINSEAEYRATTDENTHKGLSELRDFLSVDINYKTYKPRVTSPLLDVFVNSKYAGIPAGDSNALASSGTERTLTEARGALATTTLTSTGDTTPQHISGVLDIDEWEFDTNVQSNDIICATE